MAMPLPAAIRAQGPYFTVDILDQLPDDGNRYEVVHGELLVTPAPRAWHEVVVARLIHALSAYLELEPVGTVLGSRGDIVLGPSIKFEPDVFVVPTSEMRALDWKAMRHLLLIAEVLSPSSARFDRFTKRVEFQRQGIPLYWVVDAEAQVVEEWVPGAERPVVQQKQLVWHPVGARQPFELALGWLFRQV